MSVVMDPATGDAQSGSSERPGIAWPPRISCAIVRSGTSRIVVLRDEDLPDYHTRGRVILDLLANNISTDGVGGSHYQSNKVAVVGRGTDGSDFTFHFYQVVPQSRRLLSKMECSNAASASGVFATLLGLTPLDGGTMMRSINLATKQHVELEPVSACWWNGDWNVRFTHLHHLWLHMTKSAVPFDLTHDGQRVTGHIVRHGNIFVMAHVPRAAVSESLVAELNGIGAAYGAAHNLPDSMPKVMPYEILDIADTDMVCDAACFSEGQQHHSLPGSGAMALGAFLTAQNRMKLPPDTDAAETTFRFHHPSGSMTAHIYLSRSPSHWDIVATSFETPVRLLVEGSLILR